MNDTIFIKAIDDTIKVVDIKGFYPETKTFLGISEDMLTPISVFFTIISFIVSLYVSYRVRKKNQKTNWFMEVGVLSNFDVINDIFSAIKKNIRPIITNLLKERPRVEQDSAAIRELEEIFNKHDNCIYSISAYDKKLGNDCETTFTDLQSLYARTIAASSSYNEANFNLDVNDLHQKLLNKIYRIAIKE